MTNNKILSIICWYFLLTLATSQKYGLIANNGEPLQLLDLQTKALIEGPYAEIQYIHVYHNPYDQPLVTKFNFPRTDTSIFHKFEAVFQNQTIVGQIMEKEQAKRMYDWNV